MSSGGAMVAKESVSCPICLSALVQPVTPPCKHTVCLACFEASVEKTSLCCSLCRMRLSVWVRRARKSGSLVNAELWSRLQQQQSSTRAHTSDVDVSTEAPVSLRISEPGEIRREFEHQMEAARREEETLRTRAEQASSRLVALLRSQEETRAAQERSDAQLARQVRQTQLMTSPVVAARAGQSRSRRKAPVSASATIARGPMDVFLGQLTPRLGGKRPIEPQSPADSSPTAPGGGKENCDPKVAPSVGGGGDRNLQVRRNRTRADLTRCPSPPKHVSFVPDLRLCDDAGGSGYRVPSPARSSGDGPSPSGSELHLAQSQLRLNMPDTETEPAPPPNGEGTGKRRRDKGPEGACKMRQDEGSERACKRRRDECADSAAAKRRAGASDSDAENKPVPSWLEELGDWSALLAEQREVERRLEQERSDRQMAERLQQQIRSATVVDRSKGSEDAYSLRGASGQRRVTAQLSIQESCRRGHQRSAP